MSNAPSNDSQSHVERLSKELEESRREREKLNTRLKGYETIAKLAHEKDTENKRLKKTIFELLKRDDEGDTLTSEGDNQTFTTPHQKQTSLPEPRIETTVDTGEKIEQDLTKSLAVQSEGDTSLSGSSTSFSVIDKSSQDSLLTHCSTESEISTVLSPAMNIKQPETELASQPPQGSKGHHASLSQEKSPSPLHTQSQTQDETHSKSVNASHLPASPQFGGRETDPDQSLDGYIQVFPASSRSGITNSDVTSMDEEVRGGHSCVTSSRRGPMSIISLGDEEILEPIQGTKCADLNVNKLNSFNVPTVVSTITSSSQLHTSGGVGHLTHALNGTGARPKENIQTTSKNNNNANPATPTLETREGETTSNKTLMVNIPKDHEGYRINDPPYLPYGRDDPQTEISALTSFGSTLPSISPEKEVKETEHFNNLNQDRHRHPQSQTSVTSSVRVATQDELLEENPSTALPVHKVEKYFLASQAQSIKDNLTTKSGVRNLVIPFLDEAVAVEKRLKEKEIENDQLRLLVKKFPTSFETGEKEVPRGSINAEPWEVVNPPDSTLHNSESTVAKLTETNQALKSQLEQLQDKTNKLYKANKEWKDRWDMLQKQKDDENHNLRTQLNHSLESKRETDHIIASLKQELLQVNQTKKEMEKAYGVINDGRQQEKRLLDQLKQDYGTLHQEKRALEIELDTLRATRPDNPRPAESVSKSPELETELAIVKRQVSLFMDDFNNEHQERLALETTLAKQRESNQSLEAKLKRAHTMLKSRDDDLRRKAKLASDLQFQVDDLKLKLEVEQRRSAIYSSLDIPVSSSTGHQVNNSLYNVESVLLPPHRAHTTVSTQSPILQTAKPMQWVCSACTYQNTGSPTTCEMCGTPSGH